jgi:signal transduction histidine kinase
VGKLATPRRILENPNELNPKDYLTLKKHAQTTIDIIKSIDTLAPLAYAAASHHEHYNGSGYPLGKSKEEIPLIGRILAYADAYDAMTTDRAFRVGMSHEQAINQIKKEVGRQFDPHIADTALKVINKNRTSLLRLPQTIGEFHIFLQTGNLGGWLHEKSNSEPPGVAHLVGNEIRVAEITNWQMVTLDLNLKIINGKDTLKKILNSYVVSDHFIDYLMEESRNEIKTQLANADTTLPVTSYIFSSTGIPLEIIIIAMQKNGYNIMFRQSVNHLQPVKHIAQFYRNFLIDNSAVCFLDNKFKIVDTNEPFLKLFYLLQNAIAEKTPHEILTGNNIPKSLFIPWSGEMTILSATGKKAEVDVSTTVLTGAKGESAGYILHFKDISQAKISRQRMAALNDCLVNLGLEYNKNIKRILKTAGINLNAIQTGYIKPETFQPASSVWTKGRKSVPDIKTIKELKERLVCNTESNIQTIQQNNKVWITGCHTGRITNNQGILYCIFETDKILSDEEKNFLCSLGSAIANEEERQNAENRFKQSIIQLEKLHRQKNDLMAITSHDLKSPVAAMIGYADLMEDRLEKIDQRTIRHYLERITGSGKKMLRLIDNILDLERFEAGQISMSHTLLDLDVLLAECIELSRSASEEKNIKILFKKKGNNFRANIDAFRMEQVFNNLLSNAIKFSFENQIIEIVLDATLNNIIKTEIKDRGPGVPENARTHIFNRYVQAGSAQNKTRGSGLGLNIVQHIVTAHSGRVWVKNRAKGGACFTVEIPQRKKNSIQAEIIILDTNADLPESLVQALKIKKLSWHHIDSQSKANLILKQNDGDIVFINENILTPALNETFNKLAHSEKTKPAFILIAGYMPQKPEPFSAILTHPILETEVLELLEELKPHGKIAI